MEHRLPFGVAKIDEGRGGWIEEMRRTLLEAVRHCGPARSRADRG